MKQIICDLDGTIALCEHRVHLVRQGTPDWDAFFRACDQDEPNWPVIHTLIALAEHHDRRRDAEITIFSGRSDMVKKETQVWLAEYLVPHHHLRMRPEGDFRPDDLVKKEWLLEIGVENVLFTIDDRQSVVDMWRAMGLTCFQVAPGDF